jgi:uncharacterized protein YndB with AHSA1/START domain
MNKIEQTYLINASPQEVWRALTEDVVIQKWSDASATFVPQAGMDYSLWDGSIVGKIIEAVPNKKLAQTWKPNDWTIDNSVVTFTLTPVGKKTRVDLLHENVEEFDYEGTSEGWDIYYLGAIKRMFAAKAKKPRITKTATLRLRSGRAKAAKGKAAARKKVTKKKSAKKKAKK